MSELHTTTEVKPALGAKTQTELEAVLGTYSELKIQRDAIQAQMDEEKKTVAAILEDAGLKKYKAAGLNLNIIEGVSKRFDRKKALAAGLNPDDLMTVRPKKPYLDIRGEGEKAPDYESD
jgi:hypothetical protein